MFKQLQKDFLKMKNPAKAKILARFFKTGKGEYGYGDVFLGIMVPQQRLLAKKYSQLPLGDIQKLLSSKIHEHRLTALFILINQYQEIKKYKNEKIKKRKLKTIFDFYLKNTRNINNWDLIDLSAPSIIGHYLLTRDRKILHKLAKSKSLWERRIAILASFYFIRSGEFDDTLKIAEILLNDKHDLIHKAVGWMLREVGKRNQAAEEKFLKKYYKKMPRTMLRYAIEKFDAKKRQFYLKK